MDATLDRPHLETLAQECARIAAQKADKPERAPVVVSGLLTPRGTEPSPSGTTCKRCEKQFVSAWFYLWGKWNQATVCDKCGEDFYTPPTTRTCPPEFRDTDCGRFPRELQAACGRFDRFGKRGLGFVGAPGLQKSRAMWTVVEAIRLMGSEVFASTASEFIVTASKDNLWKWINPEILFLDDLGTVRLNPAQEGWFYHIIDQRGRRNKPILFTADSIMKGDKEKGDSELRKMIMGRLKDKCDVVRIS